MPTLKFTRRTVTAIQPGEKPVTHHDLDLKSYRLCTNAPAQPWRTGLRTFAVDAAREIGGTESECREATQALGKAGLLLAGARMARKATVERVSRNRHFRAMTAW